MEDKTKFTELAEKGHSPYLLSWIDPPEFHLDIRFPKDGTEDTDVIPAPRFV